MITRSFRFTTLLVVFALSCLQCAAKTKAPRASQYYMLQPGTVWVFEANFLGRSETRTIVMGPEQAGFYADDAGGKFAYDGLGLRDEVRYLIKNPVVVGTRWDSQPSIGVVESNEIVDKGPCQTKLKAFEDCVVVRTTLPVEDGRTLHTLRTFAKNVGLVRVKTETVKEGKRTPQVEMELIDFRPPG